MGESEKQTEAIKAGKTILDPGVIKEKEEQILREIEMEQQELCRREIKINLSINQQKQQKEYVKIKRGGSESVGDQQQELIGRDLWKQLRRISIPTFDGDKSTYESWKATFTACIDQAPARPDRRSTEMYQELGTFSWSL